MRIHHKLLLFTALFLGALSAGAELKEPGQFVASECGLNRNPVQTFKDQLVISRICVGELYLTDRQAVELTFNNGAAIYYEIHFDDGQIKDSTTIYKLAGQYIPNISTYIESTEGADSFAQSQIEGGRIVSAGPAGKSRTILTVKLTTQGLTAGAELIPIMNTL